MAKNRVILIGLYYILSIFLKDYFIKKSWIEDFSYVNDAAIFYLCFLAMLYRMDRTSSIISVLFTVWFLPFLLYEVKHQVYYEFKPYYYVFPLIICFVGFIASIIGASMIVEKKRQELLKNNGE